MPWLGVGYYADLFHFKKKNHKYKLIIEKLEKYGEVWKRENPSLQSGAHLW